MGIKDRLIMPTLRPVGAVNNDVGGPPGYLGPVGRGELVYVLDVPFWASKEAREKNRNEPGFVDYPVLTPKRQDEVFRMNKLRSPVMI